MERTVYKHGDYIVRGTLRNTFLGISNNTEEHEVYFKHINVRNRIYKNIICLWFCLGVKLGLRH
jgi:hypothetical protein